MEFKGFEKTSLIEWPGKAVSVAYTGGCNLRCPFCQNKGLVLGPEEVPSLSESKIFKHLKSRRKWIDGLIVSGGEPTLKSGLERLAEKAKREDLGFGLETNGTNPKVVKNLVRKGLVDYIALDIKAPLSWKKYRKAIGVENRELFENVKRTLEILQDSKIEHECRTTVVPEIVSKKDLERIGRQLEGIKNFYLQQFVPRNTLDKKFEKLDPYTIEEIREIKLEIEDNFENCEIRNIES